MSLPLSAYILTYNSEKYLNDVLRPLKDICDEIILFDSGSNDQTESIAKKWGASFIYRKFDDFMNQRNAAQDACSHDWVLFVDSDEIIDQEMVDEIKRLKLKNFEWEGKSIEAFQLKRRWYLFGHEVRAFLPISAPDYPIRLFQRSKVRFHPGGRKVHETPSGFQTMEVLKQGAIHHYSCESADYLFSKLNQYTTLAAEDLRERGKTFSWSGAFIHALGAWIKWYFKKGGWRDGSVGILLGIYAFYYTLLKYIKIKY